MYSYVMLVGRCGRGHPQRVVIELHTLCAMGSLVGSAVAEGKLLFTQSSSCFHISIIVSTDGHIGMFLAAHSVFLVTCHQQLLLHRETNFLMSCKMCKRAEDITG